MNRRLVLLAIVLCAVAALGGLAVRPVGDDWPTLRHTVRWADSGTIVAESLRPQVIHWSPLWFWTDSVCYRLAPDSYGIAALTFVRFAFLLVACIALLLVARGEGAPPVGIAAGMAILVFHQSGIATLYQWKGIGALAGHALGAMAFAVVYRRGRNALAAAILFAGLLFKEDVIAWAALIVLFALFAKRPRVIVAAAGAAVLFIVLRQLAGTPLSLASAAGEMGQRYHLVFAPEVWARNVVRLMTAVLSPISTIRWIDAITVRDAPMLAVFVAVTLIVNALIVRPRLVVAMLVSCFPIALLNHVNESYVSPLIFWYALLVALAVSRRFALIAVVAIVAMHAFFFVEKRGVMIEWSRREEAAGLAVARAASQLPAGSSVWITCDPLQHGYSFFRSFAGDQAGIVEIAHRRVPVIVAPHDFQYAMRVRLDGSVVVLRNPDGRPGNLVTPY